MKKQVRTKKQRESDEVWKRHWREVERKHRWRRRESEAWDHYMWTLIARRGDSPEHARIRSNALAAFKKVEKARKRAGVPDESIMGMWG